MNEAAMLDCNGELVLNPPKAQYLMSAVKAHDRMPFAIGTVERRRVKERFTFSERVDVDEHALLPYSEHLNCSSLCARMEARTELDEFSMSIGATLAYTQRHLFFHDDEDATDAPVAPIEDNTMDLVEDYFARSNAGDDLDEFMVAAAHGERHQGVNAKHLSKIWRIEHKDAERTIEVTDQRAVRQDKTTQS